MVVLTAEVMGPPSSRERPATKDSTRRMWFEFDYSLALLLHPCLHLLAFLPRLFLVASLPSPHYGI